MPEQSAVEIAVMDLFKELTSIQRMNLIRLITRAYCVDCGNRGGKDCQCWNDE